MRLLLAAIAVALSAGPAIANTVTLECPKRREIDYRTADGFQSDGTVYHTRYEITINRQGVYVNKLWKRTGGTVPHDWKRMDLSVEAVTPHVIRAFSESSDGSRIYTEINRVTLVVTTIGAGFRVDRARQCAFARIDKPKF